MGFAESPRCFSNPSPPPGPLIPGEFFESARTKDEAEEANTSLLSSRRAKSKWTKAKRTTVAESAKKLVCMKKAEGFLFGQLGQFVLLPRLSFE